MSTGVSLSALSVEQLCRLLSELGAVEVRCLSRVSLPIPRSDGTTADTQPLTLVCVLWTDLGPNSARHVGWIAEADVTQRLQMTGGDALLGRWRSLLQPLEASQHSTDLLLGRIAELEAFKSRAAAALKASVASKQHAEVVVPRPHLAWSDAASQCDVRAVSTGNRECQTVPCEQPTRSSPAIPTPAMKRTAREPTAGCKSSAFDFDELLDVYGNRGANGVSRDGEGPSPATGSTAAAFLSATLTRDNAQLKAELVATVTEFNRQAHELTLLREALDEAHRKSLRSHAVADHADYLKNVLVQFATGAAKVQSSLVPVLSRLLNLSQAETKQVAEAVNSRVPTPK